MLKKILTQPILTSVFLYQILKSLPCMLKKDGAVPSISLEGKKYSDLMILGNGPSLKKDLEIIKDRLSENDCMCLNNFPLQNEFEAVKPIKIVWMDSNFWKKDVANSTRIEREKTFIALNEKTEWAINLYLPHWADHLYLEKKLSNKNIILHKVKMICFPYEGSIARKLFSSGFFCPRLMNVLVAAVLIAINLAYENIYIYGADFNFHRLVDVDQSNNRTLFKQEHFYESGRYYPVDQDMYVFLQSAADSFHAHKVLAQYALEKDINIVNRSSFSLIDAYKRR